MIHFQDMGIPLWGVESLEKQGFKIFRGHIQCRCKHIAERDGSISVAVALGLKVRSKFEVDTKSWLVEVINDD